MGMTLRHLKQLHSTLKEISEEDGLPIETATSRFFEDLNDYDEIVGFKIKITKLEDDYERLNEKCKSVSSRLSKIPYVGGFYSITVWQRR